MVLSCRGSCSPSAEVGDHAAGGRPAARLV
jgi:hypothetical protein